MCKSYYAKNYQLKMSLKIGVFTFYLKCSTICRSSYLLEENSTVLGQFSIGHRSSDCIWELWVIYTNVTAENCHEFKNILRTLFKLRKWKEMYLGKSILLSVFIFKFLNQLQTFHSYTSTGAAVIFFFRMGVGVGGPRMAKGTRLGVKASRVTQMSGLIS